MSRIIGGGKKIVYEKVAVDEAVDEWLTGTIAEVQYDEHRAYQSKNKDTGEWEEKTAPHVRFKFALNGYHYPHYSRWMKASTNEKSNLYKYLKSLCPQYDCQDKAIDLDKLVGAMVKTMWENDGDYQNLTQIRGLDPTLNVIASGIEIAPGLVVPSEELTGEPTEADADQDNVR